jgi:hypothetical protein
MSGNVGLNCREDLTWRMRVVGLSFFEEDANRRVFKRPDLHGYVAANRQQILSAVYSLVLHWQKQGCPAGGTFSSFQRWGEVVGGILVAAGLGDPTLQWANPNLAAGDPEEEAMRAVLTAGHEGFGDKVIEYDKLCSLVQRKTGLAALNSAEQPVTDHWNGLREHKDAYNFDRTLKKWNKRKLGGTSMFIIGTSRQTSRCRFQFRKD